MIKQFYNHNDKFYLIHRAVLVSKFTHKNNDVNMDLVKEYKEYLYGVDHVLRTPTHFLFVETIQEAEIIEDLEIEN
jgi:hypothetical protein